MQRLIRTTLLGLAAALSIEHSHAEVLKFACEFSLKSDMEGSHLAEDGFSLQFRLDTVSGVAFLEGNAGLSTVVPIRGDQGISFLEILKSGAVQTTMVDRQGNATHSHHTIFNGELVPSQYYGQCE